QLRQLLETHLKPIRLTHHTTSASTNRNPRRHNPIQPAGSDKNGDAKPGLAQSCSASAGVVIVMATANVRSRREKLVTAVSLQARERPAGGELATVKEIRCRAMEQRAT
ncbi:hypothetical protein, partial [Mycolicibacterium austroafricanum]|uniref:hypothetical protein n=1 Tax=Mycolicibacterium austroafricanum TaxID=39687 RepID=UPI00197C6F5F